MLNNWVLLTFVVQHKFCSFVLCLQACGSRSCCLSISVVWCPTPSSLPLPRAGEQSTPPLKNSLSSLALRWGHSSCIDCSLLGNFKTFATSVTLFMPTLSKQREIIVLNKQGTQQQRPELPMVTPPGVRVNTCGGIYIPCIYSYARWSYHRQFRSLLLCLLSVKCYYFPLFVDCTQAL